MIVFPCHVCRTSLSADEAQAGQLVRCPTCLTPLKVPTGAAARPVSARPTPPERMPVGAGAGVTSSAAAPRREMAMPGDRAGAGGGGAAGNLFRTGGGVGSGRRYGFNCGYCSSRLEATEALAAQEGQCPTCGNNITIPILDRYGRLIDPHTREIIKQDPHPVHAYAAAGERAPVILRSSEGKQSIQCPRCRSVSAITANNCKSCGMPFTMEGTTLEASGASNGFCVASLVLGIIGIPAACSVIVPVLAVVFGFIGYGQATRAGAEGGGKGMAIAGIICGCIGSGLAMLFIFR